MKLTDKILQTRKQESSDWHKRQLGVYHASGIYDICTGKLKPEDYFKKSEPDDKSLIIFEIGKMYHDYIQGLYPLEAREVKVSNDFGDFKIVGKVDLLLNKVPVELKTCSQLPKKPFLSHEYQLQCYISGLGVKQGYLTYIEKNPKAFITKTFKFEKDELMVNIITQKVTEFHEKLKVALATSNEK